MTGESITNPGFRREVLKLEMKLVECCKAGMDYRVIATALNNVQQTMLRHWTVEGCDRELKEEGERSLGNV